MEIIDISIYLISLLLGALLGFRLFKDVTKPIIEPILFVVIIAAFYFGRSTYLLKIFELEITLSKLLVSFILGVLVGRLVYRFPFIRMK